MKKVSIVVPCYNTSTCLGWCIDHLIRQTIGIENIEIILVDDASTDDGATWEIIMEYESRYPENIIAISLKDNLRQGGARNVGVSYASGEYLIFCDADDWLRVEALDILYTMMRNTEADVVEFRNKDVYEYSDAEAETPVKLGSNSYQLSMVSNEDRRVHIIEHTDVFTYGCWNKLYRMSLIKEHEIKFVEHLIFEEPSFTLLVRLYETKHVFLDAVLHYCYQTPTGTMRGSWDGRKLDNAKAWLILYDDLRDRGFLEKYSAELEYMFWIWGITLTVRILLQKGYVLQIEELDFLKHMALARCPNIRNNIYLSKREATWNRMLLEILDMEFTKESIICFNRNVLLYLAKN